MGQTLANILIHAVFSTKNREPYIHQQVENELFSYMVSVCRENGAFVLKAGGSDDHVHLLFNLPRVITIADLLEEIKKSSSKWIKTKGSEFSRFSWQTGYGAFSVSSSHRDAVLAYIANQREHHKTVSFQDEFRRILDKNGVKYDERYVWD